MAMNKKERAYFEGLLTESALRRTSEVFTDVPPPDSLSDLSKGFVPVSERTDRPNAVPACSSSVYHSIGRSDKTSSQNTKHLYSTRLLALKALRYQVESDCCDRLRYVDTLIESELHED